MGGWGAEAVEWGDVERRRHGSRDRARRAVRDGNLDNFSRSKRPLYRTAMAVLPGEQRKGVGRQCLDEARKIAAEWPSDAIRLDAYDADAGAGGFYLKCGFREVGRASYRDAPLIYFEALL